VTGAGRRRGRRCAAAAAGLSRGYRSTTQWASPHGWAHAARMYVADGTGGMEGWRVKERCLKWEGGEEGRSVCADLMDGCERISEESEGSRKMG
jgi:hypothetical protein